MAELSKGKRSTGRRSSILKRALADIDLNEKTEVFKSKRVSFAETYCVKEFPRDSPQVHKGQEQNESLDKSDTSVQDADVSLDTPQPPPQQVGSDAKEGEVAGFMVDDGETLGDLTDHGGFRESTRRLDRLDSCGFGEAGGLDISEIASGDSSVFMPGPSSRPLDPATSFTTISSNVQHPGPSGHNAVDTRQPPFTFTGGAAVTEPVSAREVDGNRTVFFEDQEGDMMDLTMMNASRLEPSPPKLSARDFLNKLKQASSSSGGGGDGQKKEEQTILFSNQGDDDAAMELTQNLTQHNLTSNFTFAPQPFKTLTASLNTGPAFFNEDDGFGARNVYDLDCESPPKITAKSFLASLKQNRVSKPAIKEPSKPSILSKACYDNKDGAEATMELTCVDPVSLAFNQPQPPLYEAGPGEACSSEMGRVGESVQTEEDVTEMMELTGCVDTMHKPPLNTSSVQDDAAWPSTQTSAQSGSQSRNALMDITARYSISPTPSDPEPGQTATGHANTSACEAKAGLPVEQGHNVRSSMSAMKSGRPDNAGLVDQENVGLQMKGVSGLNPANNRAPLTSVEKHSVASSSSLATAVDPLKTVPGLSAVSVDNGPHRNADLHGTHGSSNMQGTSDLMQGVHLTNTQSNLSFSRLSSKAVTGQVTAISSGCTNKASPADDTRHVFGKGKSEADKEDKTSPRHNVDDTHKKLTNMSCSIAAPKTGPIVSSAAIKKRCVNNTVMFDKEDTGGNMSLTCMVPRHSLDTNPPHSKSLGLQETTADMSMTCNISPTDNISKANRSVQFRPKDRTADMSMTCNISPTDNISKANRSVQFRPEDRTADMSMTCNISPTDNHNKGNRSVHFRPEDRTADMSMTCNIPPTDTLIKGNRSVQFRPEDRTADMSMTCHISPTDNISKANRSVHFRPEDRTADMSMTCNIPPTDTLSKGNRSVQFRPEDRTADMSMTCNIPPTDTLSKGNRSVQFRPEDKTLDMSMTCNIPLTGGDSHDQDNKSVHFRPEDRMADMSMTCNIPPTDNLSKGNRSVHFRPEDRSADMSMTCTSLQQPSDKTLLSRTQHSTVGMSFTCVNLSQSDRQRTRNNTVAAGKCLSPEKSVLFAREATAANMSLTCADLPSSQDFAPSCEYSEIVSFKPKPDHIDAITHAQEGKPAEKSILFAREATAANMSLTCADLSSFKNLASCDEEENQMVPFEHGDKPQMKDGLENQLSSEKSVGYVKDTTAVNMSLTCADLSTSRLLETRTASSSEKSQTITFKSDKNNTSDTKEQSPRSKPLLDKIPVSPLKQMPSKDDQLATKACDSQHDVETRVATGLSQLSKSEGEGGMIESPQQTLPASLPVDTGLPVTRPAPLLTDCASEAQIHNVSPVINDQMETAEEEVSVFMNKEPTTLMDLNRVMQNLRKNLDDKQSAEEAGAESGSASEENKTNGLSPAEPVSESVQTGASRKLQITATDMLTDVFHPQPKENALLSSPLKRQGESFCQENEPKPKVVCLNNQNTSKAESTYPPESTSSSVLARGKDGGVEMLRASQGSSDQSVCRQGSSSSGSYPTDMWSETMPVLAQACNLSVSTSLMSVSHNTTASFLAMGRSFLDKQDKTEERGSFLQACEQLGVSQSDLWGRVCRRSSVGPKPEVCCDTVEDQLNSASLVKSENEVKAKFVSNVAACLNKEEGESQDLERTALLHITQQGWLAQSSQSPSLQQQVRRLLTASRKAAQVVWKTRKAESLAALLDRHKTYHQACSTDVQDMTTAMENIITAKETVDNKISEVQNQVDSLRSQIRAKRPVSRVDSKQQQLNKHRADLVSLQEQVAEAKRSLDALHGKETDLHIEIKQARQREQTNLQRQTQLDASHDTLATFHCVHCWRAVRVEDHRVELLLLYDAVLLSVSLSGPPSPLQPITSITVTPRIKEGCESWAVLATQLVVNTVTELSQRLMDHYRCRQSLPQMLDEVTSLVEDIKALAQEVKEASVRRHLVHIKGTQISVELWSREKLRKVTLTTTIPLHSYPHSPLPWTVHVVMGDLREQQIQTAISEVGAGHGHFTRVLTAVHALLHH